MGINQIENKIDPISFALIKNALDQLVDEMAYTVIRTARSEIVKDVMDFSTAFCDRKGQMMAQGKTIALHLGAIPDAIEVILDMYGDDLHQGDVIILNDPYMGGMHLPDIFMFKPVFYNNELQGFAVSITHHTDVGGRVPGSNASDSSEIFQEGLRIPPTKLYDKGKENKTLFSIIERNVRVPELVIGDLRAQHAACVVGEREFLKLVERYGSENMVIYMEELLNYAERLTRQEIRKWPKGSFEFTDYIDNDGFQKEPIPIKVKITVHEDSITVDYEGSSPQVKGAINSTLSYTKSCTYLSVRCILDKDVPNNLGVFRAIEVKVPKASVLNPESPGACAARALTGYRVVDTMFGALSQIVPSRVPAAGEGGNTVVSIGGYDESRKPFIIVDMICGAWGGRPYADGVEAITNPSQNLSNTPVETLEAKKPIRIEKYEFIRDSCGAGKYRGGLGILRQYRLLNHDAVIQVRADRVNMPPYGLMGGKPGGKSKNVLNPDTEKKIMPGKFSMDMKESDVFLHEQAGGGGFGNPYEREIELIIEDIKDEKISCEYALNEHCVVINPNTLEVDHEKTELLRSQLSN
ncbi:hydantoinase B/oxoprolinase family protein [Fredinandcohnia onubensis]|uniref:hydantoinase B/oxoprolinase family protein n=1 Tax=Fredinandcohnia onubensis TaxID=1571209 RepID=UPI000C0C0BC6|nr:hydantoinase B/oxoprolinase family protein [Fredinandcohnia onubensis]